MRCLQCMADYYLDPSTRICKNCTEVLVGCNSCNAILVNSTNTSLSCSSCNDQYYLFGNPPRCTQCSSVIENCNKCVFNTVSGKG